MATDSKRNMITEKIVNFLKLIKRILTNISLKLNPNYYYFLIQRHKHPDLFNESFSDITVMQAVTHFKYSKTVIKWVVDRAEFTLRFDYPLREDSVAFDLGGYHGSWSKIIRQKYNPYIHIFEPQPESCKVLEDNFQNENKIVIHKYGLSDRETTAVISKDGKIGASVFLEHDDGIKVKLRDIKEVIEELNIREVDLIKINIEGGEYPLLQRMIDTGIINYFRNIQIQFHSFYPRARFLRWKIRRSLTRSHRLTWDYPFIWENWVRRN